VGALTDFDHECAGIRQLLSLELDDELSQLESVRLDAHLESCARCSALKADLAAVTTALRAVPLEPLERPISIPHRARWSLRPLQVGAAVAAVTAAVGLAGLVGTVHSTHQPHFVSGTGGPGETLDELRIVRRPELIPQVPVGRAGGRPTV
jgi:predicted anti-sigma-YlaC factor YlaD